MIPHTTRDRKRRREKEKRVRDGEKDGVRITREEGYVRDVKKKAAAADILHDLWKYSSVIK